MKVIHLNHLQVALIGAVRTFTREVYTATGRVHPVTTIYLEDDVFRGLGGSPGDDIIVDGDVTLRSAKSP